MWERIKLWWRVRRWKAKDHSDCIYFLGPCNLCKERLRYLGLPDSPKPFYEITYADGRPIEPEHFCGGHNEVCERPGCETHHLFTEFQ